MKNTSFAWMLSSDGLLIFVGAIGKQAEVTSSQRHVGSLVVILSSKHTFPYPDLVGYKKLAEAGKQKSRFLLPLGNSDSLGEGSLLPFQILPNLVSNVHCMIPCVYLRLVSIEFSNPILA